MLDLQKDPSGGGAPSAPSDSPTTQTVSPSSTTPTVSPPVQPAAPVTPSVTPQQTPAAPGSAASLPAAPAPAAEPPIPADTPMIYANRSGQDQQSTVAELIDARLTLDELGDVDRLKSLKAAMDGDPAAIQNLLQGYLKDSQAAAEPTTPQAAALDPEMSQRLERLEQDVAYGKRFSDEAQQAQTLQWIQASLATEGISKHVPLTAAHPDASRRIMENINTAKVLMAAQGIDPNTPQGQQAMQQALFNSFSRVEKQLAADQAHFSGAQPNANQQAQATQAPGQPAPNASVVPQPSSGAAPLMVPAEPEGRATKQGMRDSLKAQATQMGMT